MNRFKKAAAFGAMMGKRAAETGPTRSPTPQEQEFADNLRKSMSQPRGIASVRGGPVPNGPSSNQPNYPTTGFTPGNKPPEPTFEQKTKAWFDGGQVGAPPKRFANTAEGFTHARSLDVGGGKTTEQRLAAMTPEQRQARTDQETQNIRADNVRKRDENEAYQKWYAANPGINGHGITPDHQTMMAMAAPFAPGIGVGGIGSDIPSFAKSLIPQGKGWVPYTTGVAKNFAPFVDPTKLAKPLLTAAESGAKNVGTSWLPRAATAGFAGAENYATSNFKSNVRGVADTVANNYTAGQATPGTSMAGQPQSRPGTNTVGQPQSRPGTNTVGQPQPRPGTAMTGTIPNVPRV